MRNGLVVLCALHLHVQVLSSECMSASYLHREGGALCFLSPVFGSPLHELCPSSLMFSFWWEITCLSANTQVGSPKLGSPVGPGNPSASLQSYWAAGLPSRAWELVGKTDHTSVCFFPLQHPLILRDRQADRQTSAAPVHALTKIKPTISYGTV